MPAEPQPGDAVTRLVDAVIAVSGGFTAQGDALVADLGLTAARWLLLGALQDAPATIAAVARRRGLRRQSAREGMERLEHAGLVARSPNPGDARAPLFTLTGAGLAALAEIEPRRAAWARDLEQTLDPAALATTLTLLASLRESLVTPARPQTRTGG
ncbi:DNA-binding MarR family transcriptional regulator [Asanoa ferruginea]|uniref:DNA-binding MarR family transcriptional regulator n=1 Tax=Asanoa ferruginea TaxID=53367 RepID=A0A3D9ZUC5_9ACTN|nr:MarR family winged helix-turn-helix transcriptional regulator [Asanoa ferruginea]REG00205.1 DNA-binding MarR family transcriptional regulator [Asanoa ferruginea]GIF46096.1 MarR family transcriptional regulator [Asanoa ferruginea]